MEISQIIPHIESLIFAADRPLPLLEVLDLLNNALAFLEDRATLEQVEAALEAIKEKYSTEFYAFEVKESGGGYQFLTKKEYYQTVAQLNGDKFLKRLSTAALETLAIVAYKQPISKGEIEHIRGVSTDYSIQKLLEKELIVITGRSEQLPGKPLLYATSKAFMDYFGLNSPKDLPKLKEVFDDESIQPTLIGLEADAASDAEAEARNMVVSETGELVEHPESDEGAESHLNGRRASTSETPAVDADDKKNKDLQAKLFLPFDEEAAQTEEDTISENEEIAIVNADDDNIVAGTEIPSALEDEEEVEENEDTAEEEEVSYATDEELAAFMYAAADVAPKDEDEDEEDDEDDEEENEDGDDADSDEDDEDDDDDEDEDEDEDTEEEDNEEDDDNEDEDEEDEEDTDSDDDDEDNDDLNADNDKEAKDKENDDAAFAAAASEDFDEEDIDDDFDEEDDFDEDEDDDNEKR